VQLECEPERKLGADRGREVRGKRLKEAVRQHVVWRGEYEVQHVLCVMIGHFDSVEVRIGGVAELSLNIVCNDTYSRCIDIQNLHGIC